MLDAPNHYGHYDNMTHLGNIDGGYMLDKSLDGLSTSHSSDETLLNSTGLIRSYWEMWDYRGGCRFRGFVAERDEETAMFVFFDEGAFGHGLKPGYVLSNLTIRNYG